MYLRIKLVLAAKLKGNILIFQTTDEANLPLSINCWPSDNGQGGCDVNIEYELEQEHLELNDVVVSIPIP